jgi:RND family efflux transporter MFP subunit
MSLTMLLGRIMLPMFGLSLMALLIWQVAATGSIELPSLRNLASWNPSPARSPVAKQGSRFAAGPAQIVAEGRVVAYPGAEVVVGAEVTGTLLNMPVQEKSVVRRGDLLVEFKSEDVQSSIREANAHLAEAVAELAHCVRDGLRLDVVEARGAGTSLERDRLHHDLSAARARQDAAKAALERLYALQARHRIVAPIDGVVLVRHAHPGETVNIAAPLVTIVDLKRLRVEAEVDEYDIGRCALGSTVTITAEGYRGRSWRGEVEEIADAVVGRGIRPEDPSRATDTSVLPVKVTLREPTPLKLGQRVEVQIAARTDRY